jgi:DNA-binding response OmpR family regulator
MLPNVLIVDDSMVIRRMLQLALAEICQMEVATTATEGLERARQKTPALLIMSENLPDRKGVDVCQELAKDEKLSAVRVIILSNREEETILAPYKELPAVVLGIRKPFSPAVVADKVFALIDQPTSDEKPRVSTFTPDQITQASEILRKILTTKVGRPNWLRSEHQGRRIEAADINRLIDADTVEAILADLTPLFPTIAVNTSRLIGVWDNDGDGVRRPLADWFQRRGYQMLDVTGREDYLEFLLRERPCAAVINVESLPPSLPPEQLAKAIRAKDELKSMKLLATCRRGGPEGKQGWRDAGFDMVFVKPFSVRELFRVLDDSPTTKQSAGNP